VLASSPFDLLVIDHAPDRVESVELMFRLHEIAALKAKPDGSRRLVLAYMSIGEAERYRFYWNDAWVAPGNCPAWLGPVNPQWAGNYPVEFWQPMWQSLIFGQSDSYVDRVLAAGFDGIYLDRADVYEQFKSRPSARAEMGQFLIRLMDHARSINPDAIVVLQNAEEMVRNKDVRTRLDGVAKESLYFNADSGGKPTPTEDQATVLSDLRLAKKAGGKVLVVEYLDDQAKALAARLKAEREGFLIHFAERSLSTLNLLGADAPVAPGAVSVLAPAGDQQLVRSSPCG
jgi:cysteinyl-tRNA synthetase, unknown class